MCMKVLTQHSEADLAPEVLSTSLDFTIVLSRVGQQQVTDQQGGVPAQVLPGKGQTAGLALRGLVGVHLASKESNNLGGGKGNEQDFHLPLENIMFTNCLIAQTVDAKCMTESPRDPWTLLLRVTVSISTYGKPLLKSTR